MDFQPPPVPQDALHVVGAAIVDGERCLSVQRSATMKTPLKWEFPGGKVEAGEEPEAALEREIWEELGLHIRVLGWLGRGVHPTSRGPLVLDVYRAETLSGTLQLREHRRSRWLTREELHEVEWAAPDIPVLRALGPWLTPRGERGTPSPDAAAHGR